MAYSDFTLESAGRLLGVVTRGEDLFPELRRGLAPDWLTDALARGGQGVHLSLISEKSRSEFVVAPMLLAARELSGGAFSIYSGQRLDVDASRGLVGECDFLLAATEAVLPLRAPIAAVVEAKKNDIEAGLGPCVAQMVAAAAFNHETGKFWPIHGCVTTGEVWQFLRLDGDEARIDRRRYYLDDVGGILGAFGAIVPSRN